MRRRRGRGANQDHEPQQQPTTHLHPSSAQPERTANVARERSGTTRCRGSLTVTASRIFNPGVGRGGAGEYRDDRGGMTLTVDSRLPDPERLGDVSTVERITADGGRGQRDNLARHLHAIPLPNSARNSVRVVRRFIPRVSLGVVPLVSDVRGVRSLRPGCVSLVGSAMGSSRNSTRT